MLDRIRRPSGANTEKNPGSKDDARARIPSCHLNHWAYHRTCGEYIPDCPHSDLLERSIAADVLLRQAPDEEEDEEEDEDDSKAKEDDDDDGTTDEGYSE